MDCSHKIATRRIVAKCPGLAGTVLEFGPMSRLCPGLPDFAALSRNPARLHNGGVAQAILSYISPSITLLLHLCSVTVVLDNSASSASLYITVAQKVTRD